MVLLPILSKVYHIKLEKIRVFVLSSLKSDSKQKRLLTFSCRKYRQISYICIKQFMYTYILN